MEAGVMIERLIVMQHEGIEPLVLMTRQIAVIPTVISLHHDDQMIKMQFLHKELLGWS